MITDINSFNSADLQIDRIERNGTTAYVVQYKNLGIMKVMTRAQVLVIMNTRLLLDTMQPTNDNEGNHEK